MKRYVKFNNVDELFDLNGKVCLLTGTGGMGKVLAESFASKGAILALADINMEDAKQAKESIEKNGGQAEIYKLDVSNSENVNSVVNSVLKQFGRIDVLIHTAGITFNSEALEFEEKHLDKVLDINLKGTILMCQHVGRVMAKQKYGKIINIGSIGGSTNHLLDSMPYEASKAGVHQVTRALAAEFAKYGINVNAIAPTWVNTKMVAGKPQKYYDCVNMATPLGRFIEPEELIGAAVFLATDASNFVTGHILYVDGGWSISKAFVYN